MFLNAVPARLPLIPKFASVPRIFAESSIESPASAAIGATNLNASPRSSSVCDELFAVAVSTSQTRSVSDASKSNARNAFPAISVASGISVCVDRERFITESIAASICGALNPARPSSAIAFATSAAVKLVVRPSSLARSVNIANSSPVEPLTA